LALTIIPENLCNLDSVSKLVLMRTAQAPVAVHVPSMGNIVSCTHVLPEIATSSKTGDARNEGWIVNSHRGLANWIDVHD